MNIKNEIQCNKNEIYSFFGNRKVFVAREMTKMFEEHIYTDLENLISSTKELKKKGEYVIVIAKKGYRINEFY